MHLPLVSLLVMSDYIPIKGILGMEFFLDQRKYIASSKIESFFCQTLVSAYVF